MTESSIDYKAKPETFTEAEKQEIRSLSNKIDLLYNKILCSNMADGSAYFDEAPLRKKWSNEIDEANARIDAIAGGRDWIKEIFGE